MITPRQLRRELDDVLRLAGIRPDTIELAFSDDVDREHARNRRRYATVDLDERRVEVAHAALDLPAAHRRGVLAHEVGHLLACEEIGLVHSEDEADEAAAEHLGVVINYDRRWPGKGLQRVLNSRDYSYLPLDVVEQFIPLMRRQGVSVVARSPRGFLTAYRRTGGDARRLSERWQNERRGFLSRHLAQVRKRREPLWQGGAPTRRHLALIAWAYSPDL